MLHFDFFKKLKFFNFENKLIINYKHIYLYIKEVAVKGGNQSIALSSALSLDFNVEMETYVDNAKKENMNSGITQDPTIATSTLPKAGLKTIIFIIQI